MENKIIKLRKSLELALHVPELVRGCVLGGGIYNTQPRSNYTSSMICLSIVLICFDFTISISYDYKKDGKSWLDFLKRKKTFTKAKESSITFASNFDAETNEKLEAGQLRTRELLDEFTKLGLSKCVIKANELLVLIKNAQSHKNIAIIENELLKLESRLPKTSLIKKHNFANVRQVKRVATTLNNLKKALFIKGAYTDLQEVKKLHAQVTKNGGWTLERLELRKVFLDIERIEKDNNL